MRNQRVVPLSAGYLINCDHARQVTQDKDELGCYGGNLAASFWFCEADGVVSEECYPYEFQYWYGSHVQAKACALTNCPSDIGSPWLYQSDSTYIVAGTSVTGGSEQNIRVDMFYRGPVASGFEVRQDFVDYWKQLLEGTLEGSATVYTPQPADADNNPVIGGHAVTLVGWGFMDDVDYWVIANTWGANQPQAPLDSYGINGYFLMRRGINAAGIEGNVVGCLPSVDSSYINAMGRPYNIDGLKLCNFHAFEVNMYTLFNMDLLQFVPHHLSINSELYYVSPPQYAPTQIDQLATCPSDRELRCSTTGLCVNDMSQCGNSIPSVGEPLLFTAPANHKAAAREYQQFLHALPLSQQFLHAGTAHELQKVGETYPHITIPTTYTNKSRNTLIIGASVMAALLVTVLVLQVAVVKK